MIVTVAALANRSTKPSVGSVAGWAVKHAAPGVGGQGSGGEPGEMLVAFSQPEELHDLLSMCELPLVPGGRSILLRLLLSLLLFVIYLPEAVIAPPLLLVLLAVIAVVLLVLLLVLVVVMVVVAVVVLVVLMVVVEVVVVEMRPIR